MDNVLGSRAFAGIVVAQFLAVVAVSKWHASTSATDDLHRRSKMAWVPRFIARWRAVRRTARQRRIQDIAKKGLAAIE